MQYTIQTVLFLRSLNLFCKCIITSLFLYPLLLGAPLPLGALRVRVVCLWVNPALPESGGILIQGSRCPGADENNQNSSKILDRPLLLVMTSVVIMIVNIVTLM